MVFRLPSSSRTLLHESAAGLSRPAGVAGEPGKSLVGRQPGNESLAKRENNPHTLFASTHNRIKIYLVSLIKYNGPALTSLASSGNHISRLN
jgi:hypothetical protein